MAEVEADITKQEAKDALSKVDMLGLENPPSKDDDPLKQAGYFLRMRETHDVIIDRCELCGQKNAIVKSVMSVNGRWFMNEHLCEVCAPDLTKINEEDTPFDDLDEMLSQFETTVGTPLPRLSDDMKAEIRERFGQAN
jgi:tRNA U54 and U55 pseudouridine synthase Pus10